MSKEELFKELEKKVRLESNNKTEKQIQTRISNLMFKIYEVKLLYPGFPDNIVYGFKNKETGVIEYVGEAVWGAWRIYEHFQQKNNKSFVKANGLEMSKEERLATWEPILLWHGKSFHERMIKELEMKIKFKPKYNKELYPEKLPGHEFLVIIDNQ